MSGFLYIEPIDYICKLDDVIDIEFTDAEDEDDFILTIRLCEDREYTVEGKQAEEVYLKLVKVLPNLIVISDE